MRYKNDEATTLGGFFESGLNVTIKIIDSAGQSVLLITNQCIEAPDEDGLYLWSTSNMHAEQGTYFYIMTDGVNKMPGKFIYGGYVDTVANKTDITNSKEELEAIINIVKTVAESAGLDEVQLHKALDTYINKVDWQADPNVVREAVWGKVV